MQTQSLSKLNDNEIIKPENIPMISVREVITDNREFHQIFNEKRLLCEQIPEEEFNELFDESGYLKSNPQALNTENPTTEKEKAIAAIYIAAIYLRKLCLINKEVSHRLNQIGLDTFLDRDQIRLDLCTLQNCGAIALANVLPCARATYLDLSLNKIYDEGAIALSKNTTIISLNVSDNNIGVEGAIALSKNITITKLTVSFNKIGDEGENAFIDAAPNNYAICEIIGLSYKTREALRPYWERNIKLKFTFDSINKIISDPNPTIESLQSAIDLAVDLSKKMENENSEAANKIKSDIDTLLIRCIRKKIELHRNSNDIQGEINTLLDIPQINTHYENLRFSAFARLYYYNPSLTKPNAFAQALKTLVQDDNSLLVTFKDERDQKEFDVILAGVVNKKLVVNENGIQLLKPEERGTCLIQALSRWIPTEDEDIASKSKWQSLLLNTTGVVEMGMFASQLKPATSSLETRPSSVNF